MSLLLGCAFKDVLAGEGHRAAWHVRVLACILVYRYIDNALSTFAHVEHSLIRNSHFLHCVEYIHHLDSSTSLRLPVRTYGGKSAQKLKWYRAVVYNFTNKKIHMVSRISYIPLDMKKDVQFIREQKNVFSARRKFYSTHA